ncbi:PAS domain S-box protein [bacterium]|nr:PAS domain S-box protein [bacterium]
MSDQQAFCRRLARWIAGFVITVSLAVLLGWAAKLEPLTKIAPGMASMKVNTAIAFCLASMGLWWQAAESRVRLVRLAGLAVAALGLASLFEDICQFPLGIDEFFFRDTFSGGSGAPGRMSPGTGAMFGVLGVALCLTTKPLTRTAASFFATMGILGSLLALTGYVYDIHALYRFPPFSSMALHTALSFLLLNVGLHLAMPEQPIVALFLSPSAGGTIARTMLPVTIIVPFVIGWLRLIGERAGFYGPAFGIVLHSTSVILIMAAATGYCAWVLDRVDKRRRSERLEHVATLDRLRLLSELLEQSSQPFVVGSLKRQIIWCNPAFEQLTGYALHELQGMSGDIMTPEASLDAELGHIDQSIRSSKPVSYERDLTRKDGSLVPISVTVDVHRDEQGRPLNLYAFLVDISNRKELENRFRDAVELSPTGIVMVAESGDITFVNAQAEQMFRYPRAELIGQPVEKLIPARFLARHQQDRTAFFEKPVARPMGAGRDLWAHRSDGSEFPVEIGLSPIRISHQMFVVASIVDISARKAAEEQSRQLTLRLEQTVAERTQELTASNKELEAFSYTVSHDLRAPLRAIDGFSRMLVAQHKSSLPASAQELLHDIRQNAQIMGQLVDDLLRFSRLGRQALQRQSVHPREIVDTVLKDQLAALPHRKISVHIDELSTCRADPALVKQVWINLLSNAIKYTSKTEQAEIWIGSRRGDQADQITYFIRDNGVGFDMQYAGKLFGVFQRMHRAEDFEGTGVGLAIVQRIIQRHDGVVWANSEVNQGSTFYFTLPESH